MRNTLIALLFLCSCRPAWNASTSQFLATEQSRVDPYFYSKQAGLPFSANFYDTTSQQFEAVIADESDSLVIGILKLPLSDIWSMRPIDSLGVGSKLYYERKQAILDAKLEWASTAYDRRKKK